jgi:hypothetical protein
MWCPPIAMHGAVCIALESNSRQVCTPVGGGQGVVLCTYEQGGSLSKNGNFVSGTPAVSPAGRQRRGCWQCA